MSKTPIQKSISEIEAHIVNTLRQGKVDEAAGLGVALCIITDNLQYEREEIIKAFEFSTNLKTDLSAQDYYTKTYEHDRDKTES